ncbi:MAG: hypothetical protein R2697_09020 [Ilumatobacteraceae bacterium]
MYRKPGMLEFATSSRGRRISLRMGRPVQFANEAMSSVDRSVFGTLANYEVVGDGLVPNWLVRPLWGMSSVVHVLLLVGVTVFSGWRRSWFGLGAAGFGWLGSLGAVAAQFRGRHGGGTPRAPFVVIARLALAVGAVDVVVRLVDPFADEPDATG